MKRVYEEVQANHLEELINLSQQIASVLDDMGHTVHSTTIDSRSGKVEHQCNPNFFLSRFSTFDVQKRLGRERYPFKIFTEIEGVHFFAILKSEDIQLINDHLPKEWLQSVKGPVKSIQVNQTKSPLALACE
ncbi:hypothetical protein [Sporosarcina sp. OR05]|uniref:hypothetical protein n=1 Tax=Sporosarcina sp. OR05 TaxID=2969819 RepID=UPI00352A735C